jgi:hypothetical protein
MNSDPPAYNKRFSFCARPQLSDCFESIEISSGVFQQAVSEATQRHLPEAIRSYVASERMIKWHSDYLKNYRDALAHRIPLYIPPSELTPEEGERFRALQNEEADCILTNRWDRLEEVKREQNAIGRPCFAFLHSYAENSVRPVLLHPQLLSDALTLIEFGNLFLQNWHQRTDN